MTDFTIKALNVIDAPPNQSGTRVLASYDISIGGVRLKNAALIENRDGIATAKGLLGKTNKGDHIMAIYEDPALARAITRAAINAYTALTGKELNDE